MSFFKKFFSQRTMNIIAGTCICIWLVLFTLFIIEFGFFADSDGLDRRWTSRIKEFDEFIPSKKEKVEFFTDTVYGTMFQFKDMLVIPLTEMKVDSLGEWNRILNFNIYNTTTKIESDLFPTNQDIFHSELVQVKDYLVWFIEAKDSFFIYDNQSAGLVKASCPSGYSFIYPETFKIEEKEDIEELEDEEKQPAETKIPDIYLTNKTLPSFSVIGNQLLLCAQKEEDKRYWIYDLETKEIRELGNK